MEDATHPIPRRSMLFVPGQKGDGFRRRRRMHRSGRRRSRRP